MQFGQVLKLVRKELGLSQQELADRMGTSKQVICRYELGQRSPDLEIVQQWEKALLLPIGALTCGDQIPESFFDLYPGSFLGAYRAWQAAVWAHMMDGFLPISPEDRQLLALYHGASPVYRAAVTDILQSHQEK